MKDLTASVLLMHAPKGIALSSGEHLQMSASDNLIATAGKNADVGVAKNFFIGVGNMLSVFVRKLGIKLIANQGPVSVQAQNDMLELLARKGISIISTEDEIKITAKKKITLNGGGSYITLDENKIESGTAGEYLTKAGNYGRLDKAVIKPIFMALPIIKTGDYDLHFTLINENTGQALKDWPYEMELSTGVKIKGVTDENGLTELISSKKNEVAKISIYDIDEEE